MTTLNRQELTAKYCYNALIIKKSGSEVERLGNTLFNSKIKLTPHQIQAALFAFKSPLSKGVILADEVGLGKTIEAGIVISQTWYEKRGKILVVAPAALMRQWQAELHEKFALDALILDRKYYNLRLRQGYTNPIKSIETPVIICSYQMCSTFKEEIHAAHFELVVIDEAHKLRNVHNEKSLTANNIKYALEHFKKVLLTATPIQNNLLDLYGISSMIDTDLFGDKTIFRHNYIKNYDIYEQDLEMRLSNILHRTLRCQVQPYIQFTNRIPKTYTFELTDNEKNVYEKIRELITSSDEDSYLIPKSQKHLLLLILCKLMGSSMHSIVFTLGKMRDRLLAIKETGENFQIDIDSLGFDDDSLDEEETVFTNEDKELNLEKLNQEILNLDYIISLANEVNQESKYTALKNALEYAFDHLRALGAEEKVLIFTESRRTQDYLYQSLIQDGYNDILLFNGSNSDEKSKKILNEWLSKECNNDKANNGKTVNMRTAILEKFKESGKILIATEAGAEGLNLQFCSLVINYDLPWNPQRVEQRIGRCHRFGQKFDVVVINFISSSNVVEQRIYELLNSKFKLFEEILGSSDSVLGSIEDGKDIEKSIVEIYSTCRTKDEINAAFDELQERYKEDIETSINKAKEELLKNFEEDVQKYFTDVLTSTEMSISEIESLLWRILKSLWSDKIKFEDDYIFQYDSKHYCLTSRNHNNQWIDFNLHTTLGKLLSRECSLIERKSGTIKFNITNYPYKLSRVSNLKGKNGYITIKKVSIESFELEEFLVPNGVLSDGTRLDTDLCKMLFRLDTEELSDMPDNSNLLRVLESDSKVNVQSVINDSHMKNNKYLAEEIEKINACTDDKIQSVQFSVELMRSQRKELQQQSDSATTLLEKEEIEKQILDLSRKIRQSWMNLAIAEEELEEERKLMIESIKKANMNKISIEELFTIYFEVI